MFTIGADPEVFATSNGSIVSAIGTIGGYKDEPLHVTDGALQEDNVLAEFNINPALTKEGFKQNIKSVLSDLDHKLHQSGLSYVIQTSYKFDRKYLKEQGYQATEFGCGAEFDAYTGMVLPKPKGATTGLRTAGGHIHVGYDNPTPSTSERIAQMMDYRLGLVSLLLDGDKVRRKLYGKAGAIRYKPYGVEYRTLSNFWLSSDDLMDWVYEETKWCVENHTQLEDYAKVVPQGILVETINKSDNKSARGLIEALGLEVPNVSGLK